MAIDQDAVKKFWDARAKTCNDLPFESIVSLEQDSENLRLKIELETAKMREYLPNVAGSRILDLGAGVGQWSFRFIEGGAAEVVAVEYSHDLVEIGRKEAHQRGVDSIRFVVSPAEKFEPEGLFDVVFISGLFVYLNDDQAQELVAKLPAMLHHDGQLILRDGTATSERYELISSFSQHLQTQYSAIYRTRDEYIAMFDRVGLRVKRDENVFYEGCPLNKYPETRLRVYDFELKD